MINTNTTDTRKVPSLPSPQEWRTLFERILLILGGGLTVFGVIFFFAYNWADMGRFAKLGSIQGAFVLSVLASWLLGRGTTLAGKTFTVVSMLLIGPMFAVYGQIYQTGADAFELFRAWWLLATFFAIASRTSIAWFLWAGLLNTFFMLYWHQTQVAETPLYFLLLFAINGGLFLAWEAAKEKLHYLKSSMRWTQRVLFLGAWSALTGLILMHIVSTNIKLFKTSPWLGSPWVGIGYICFLLGTGAILFIYRKKQFDLVILTGWSISIITIITTFIITKMTKISRFDSLLFLFWGAIILVQSSAAFYWLLSEYRKNKAAQSPETTHTEVAHTEVEKVAEIKDVRPPLEKTKPKESYPWYLAAMISVGAWISSIFFLLFLGLFSYSIFKYEFLCILFGSSLIGGLVYHSHKKNVPLFLSQVNLCFLFVGQFLFYYGLTRAYGNLFNVGTLLFSTNKVETFLYLSIIVTQPLLIKHYNSRLYRFLGTFFTSITLMALAWRHEPRLGPPLVLLLLAGISVFLYFSDTGKRLAKHDVVRDLRLAQPFVLLLLLVASVTPHALLNKNTTTLPKGFVFPIWSIATAGMFVFCAVVLSHIRRSYIKHYSLIPTTALITLLLLTVSFWSTPSMLGASLVLMLGFYHRSISLQSLSTIAFVLFLGFSYYNLNLTLLQKSIAMFVPGIIFVALGVFLVKNKRTTLEVQHG